MITNIKLVGIFVEDQDRAVDFYTNKLGFRVVVDQPMRPGARWIEVAPPGAETTLAIAKPYGPQNRVGGFSGIVFRCADIQATYEELRSRGVEFTDEPRDQPGGVMARFVDGDGNEFVLLG